MSNPDIDMICPNCGQKAGFFADGKMEGSYIIKPSKEGKVICKNCGLNKQIIFQKEMYYFQIPIGKRVFYARKIENLKILQTYFGEEGRLHKDPDLDFPAEFYKHRLKLAELIKIRIEEEEKQ